MVGKSIMMLGATRIEERERIMEYLSSNNYNGFG